MPNEIEALYDLTYDRSNTSEIQYNCFITDVYFWKDGILLLLLVYRQMVLL